jgi:hypothetical protein
MKDLEEISALIEDVNTLRRAIISGRRKSFHPNFERIDIRPVLIRDQLALQIVSHDGKQDHTKNIKPTELKLNEVIDSGFANIRIERTVEDIDIKITKKGKLRIHRKPNNLSEEINLGHDRIKERKLDISDPIFRHIEIADQKGKLIPRQSDKFHQVDDFLRIIDDVIPSLGEGPVNIVDLGCGNAYLTFATNRFLAKKGLEVRIVGVDSRVASRERNSEIAKKAGLNHSIEFHAAKIGDFPITPTSLVIALHACDTATDDALVYAVRSKAKAILVSPCCHHDLNKNLKSPDSSWRMIFRHGIAKERLADLLTDTFRAEILKILGYRSEIIEFVSLDHTPRNLLIRAVLAEKKATPADFTNLDAQLARWSVTPYLYQALTAEISARRREALG